MGVVELAVNMHGASSMAMAQRPTPQIRIMPALAPNEGLWEWAVVEEQIGIDGRTITSRRTLANDLAKDPLSAAVAAASCFQAILVERFGKDG